MMLTHEVMSRSFSKDVWQVKRAAVCDTFWRSGSENKELNPVIA